MHASEEDGWEEALGLPILNFSTECWVYRITCGVNGKHYIGISNDIARRYNEHVMRAGAVGGKGYDYKLSRALRKYGEDSFIVTPMLYGPREFCALIEVSYIGLYDSYENGYNSSLGGEGSSFYVPWNKGSKGLCKPNSTSFTKGGKSARQKMSEQDIARVLKEYGEGVPPKKMNWLPVHWSNAYRAIKKHR